ncbi:MAG: sensor histidine kinase [Chloroflexota bacterium]
MVKLRRRLHHLNILQGDWDDSGTARSLHHILSIFIVTVIPVSLFHLATKRVSAALILGASIVPVALCFGLIRRGRMQLAGYISLLSMLVTATTLVICGNGLQDIAILVYPVLILAASMLLERRSYLSIVTMALVALAGVTVGQLNGSIANFGRSSSALASDLAMATIILGITAIVSFVLAENIRQTVQQEQRKQEALDQTNQKLQGEIVEHQRADLIEKAIYRISEAAHTSQNLTELYISIHKIIRELMHARNFYISLYDEAENLITTPYLADDYRKSWPPYEPGRGLAAYVLRTGKPLLIAPSEFSELERSGHVEIILKRMIDWLGVPLKTSRGTIGVMVVQTYIEEERLSEADKDVLIFVSTQVANAIERKRTEVERKALIAELEAKNAELERFTYTVSHDLKSPLITIRGFADFVQRDLQTDNIDRARQDVERIILSAVKMQKLLNDLLELSRIGRLVNEPVKIPFGTIVSEALSLLAGPISAHGTQVKVIEEMPTIQGDRARLVEVVQNLVENALKFMGEQSNPTIEIGFQESTVKGMPVFFVRDNGIGIEPQFHQKVFGLFEKLDARGEGTGIGLALVKRIIEVHGGTIWISSIGNGCGTTFYFTLPAAQNEP